MIDYLHSQKIAHGDLQHGNILIQDNEIKLVDYDSLFCPGMEGMSDIITGKADFQHPNRKNAKEASYKVDYFSELVIYLSILAIAERPELVTDFSLEDSLLFKASDWNDFANSPIYRRISSIGNENLNLLLLILEEYLSESNINNLHPFTDLCRERSEKPHISTFYCGRGNCVVYKGEETSVKWQAEHVSKQYLNDQEIPLSESEVRRTFNEDTNITLKLRNGLHSVVQKIFVQVVEKPIIEFRVAKPLLRKTESGIEHTSLSWSVLHADKVVLKEQDKATKVKNNEHAYSIKPKEDTTYTLVVTGLDRKTEFTNDVTVLIRVPAKITFKTDKQYTLPNVPIKLSWHVTNAQVVKLNGRPVESAGKIIDYPKRNSQYELSVEDDFGCTVKILEVQMLPLPIIESLQVPMPDWEQECHISYIPPKFPTLKPLPQINTKFIDLDLPHIPDVRDCLINLDVAFQQQPRKNLIERCSRFLKNLFK
jgi:serine/threonine protein kinase